MRRVWKHKALVSISVGTAATGFESHWNIKQWRQALGKTDETLEHFCKYDLFYINFTKVTPKVKDIASCYYKIGSEKWSYLENSKLFVLWSYEYT